MPEIRHYRVTQSRQVDVRANNAAEAVRIANAAFRNGQSIDNGALGMPEGVYGNTTSRVRETDISAFEQ